MKLSGLKKSILAVVGTVILGALGSALWDLALKPGSQWLGNAILTAATLGSNSLKDSVYRNAAKGLHEEAALVVFVLFSYWMVALLGTLYAISYITITRILKRTEHLKKRIDDVGDPSQELIETEASHQEGDYLEKDYGAIHSDLERMIARMRRIRKSHVPISLLTLLTISIMLFVDCLKMDVSNNAYTFFRQSMAICRPYMSDQDAQLLRSRFASVNTRADYVAVIHDLQHIAAAHQRKLPNFKPW